MESDSVIQNIFSMLNGLGEREKRIFADFERRIGILYRHKIALRKTRAGLLELKQLIEESSAPGLRGTKQMLKRSKISNSIFLKKKTLAKDLKKISSILYYAFFSFNLPDELGSVSSKQIADVESFIHDSIEKMDAVQRLKGTEAGRRFAVDLRARLALKENDEGEASKLNERLASFRHLIDSQGERVKDEIIFLNGLSLSLENNTFIVTDIEKWVHYLENYEDELERLLKAEKEAVHDLLDEFIFGASRPQRLADNIAQKKNTSIADLNRDLQTFSNPLESGVYAGILLKNQAFSKDANRYLATISMMQAKRAREIETIELPLLQRLASNDRLTGLHNRHYVESAVSKLRLMAGGVMPAFAVLFIDVDYFKRFNDDYDHDTGDMVLKKVAETIKSCARRKSDIVARWGGEEFLVVIQQFPGELATPIDIAEKIRRSVASESQPFLARINEQKRQLSARPMVTVSIGVAYSKERNSFPEIVHLADERLYQAKKRGRNCVVSR
ncbi:MAG: GGDEF domain-containing protein [Candidatus Woesearchaeota archaeon]